MTQLDNTFFKYCPKCGSMGSIALEGTQASCNKCEFVLFFNPASSVAAIISHGNKILLTKRKKNPSAGLYDFPGGFIDMFESLEIGLSREINEELGLSIHNWKYLFSCTNEYNFSNTKYHTVDAYFYTEISEKNISICEHEIVEFGWFEVKDINMNTLAFESTKNAVKLFKQLYLSKLNHE